MNRIAFHRLVFVAGSLAAALATVACGSSEQEGVADATAADTGAEGAASGDEGLAADAPAEVEEDARTADSATPTTTQPVAAVFADPTFPVAVTEDVVFAQGLTHADWGTGEGTPKDLMLDVYEPVRDAAGTMPVVVVIHGGGFTGGTRKHAALSAMARAFAERGWVAFSIDYRVVGDHGTLPADWPELPLPNLTQKVKDQIRAFYPACRDAKAAIRWVAAHADDYGIHPGHVAAIGGSAGSYLAVALGVTDDEDCTSEVSVEQDPTLAGTHLQRSAAVHTIIDHWGGPGVAQVLQLRDGVSRFDATDAPISIVHGTDDATVAFSQGEELRDLYQSTGAAHAFHPLEGAGHGPWNVRVDGQTLTELAYDFIVLHQGLTVE